LNEIDEEKILENQKVIRNNWRCAHRSWTGVSFYGNPATIIFARLPSIVRLFGKFLQRSCTFAAMADANPDVHDCLVRCTGMYMMDVRFSSARRLRWTLADIYSLDYANTLQRRHSIQLGGPCATVRIRWTFLKDKQNHLWTIIMRKKEIC